MKLQEVEPWYEPSEALSEVSISRLVRGEGVKGRRNKILHVVICRETT